MTDKKKNKDSGQDQPKESRFREFGVPKEIEENSAEWQTVRMIFAKGIGDGQKADKEAGDENRTKESEAVALWKHAVSTANLCYQYYKEYMEKAGNYPQINETDLYIAAIYFNYYKLSTGGDEHKDLSPDKEKELLAKQIEVSKELREKNSRSQTIKYLFVQDHDYQYAHEIIYVANTLDNLLCLRDSSDEPLSLFSVFSILAQYDGFNPGIVKNFEKMFVGQIKESADTFRLTFTSIDEKRAYTELAPKVRDSFVAAIAEALGTDKNTISVKTLEPESGQETSDGDGKLIVFASDPRKPVKFYDKRTMTLYSLN